jgi:LuxR family transcriptional regulator, maltose regulon positive regulatory protein
MLSSAAQNSVYYPRTIGMIERHRLLQNLTAVFDHKLTIICAPPGYGKTTLTGQFVQQSQNPFAWHTIEERERDLPNLLAHSLSALEQVAPGIKKLGTLPGYTPRELAAVVANYLRDQTKNEFLYVLDDVHYLAGSPAAETWLETLVALLPPNCHLIMLSRALPNLPITEMVARREMLAIGQEQLRFTQEEISRLASSFGSEVTLERAQELAERLEGWPAGTVLAFQPLPSELESAVLQGGKGPEALFEALAVGVLQAQPPTLKNFLLESSTLSHITPELCDAVLEIPNSAERFSEALNRHTFLTQVPGGLIYHRLFRQFLQQELWEQNKSRFVALHLKAAWWFEQHDRIEDAVEHYITAGQYSFAIALAEQVAQAYYAQGKVETLLGWKGYVAHATDYAPKLFLMCAKIHTDRYDYVTARSELVVAEQGFMHQEEENGVAEVQLQRSRCDLQQANYDTVVSQSGKFLAAWTGADWLRGRALRTLGFAQVRLGDIKNAVANLEAALPIYRNDGDAHALSQLLQDMVIAYAQAGRLKEVNACLQEVVALRRSLGSPGALAQVLNNLGYFYHRCSDYQQALTTLEEGLSVIVQVSDRRTEGHLLWSLADVKRDLGAFDEALRLYYKALEFIGSSEPPTRCSILLSISTLCRWQEQFDEALGYADEAITLAEQHRLPYEGLLAQAISWAARGQDEDNNTPFDQLQLIASELSSQYAQFETLQALACCIQIALEGNQPALAKDFLHHALKVVEETNTAQPLAAEIAHTPILDTFMRSNKKGYAALKDDLDHLFQAQNATSGHAQTQSQLYTQITYSLRVWTLGQERIERDGKRILPSEWRASASRELFLYLLLVGPSTREEISLNFWPDSSSKQVRQNFHTTLYRTRQALGDNVIVLDDERYLINPDLALWCDAHEMQKLIQQAQLLSIRDGRTEDLWRRAVNLYLGAFVPSIDAEWAAYYRERLQETHIEALIGAANCVRARSKIQESLSFLKQALLIDPYREDVYRGIMQCYADLGERKQVLAHYQDLQRVLRQELSITPSRETVKLFERLVQ